MKVLVVDDEEDVRYVARMSLGRIGKMTVIEAASGDEAIALARSERPDVILLDMMMPGMNGTLTFAALRDDDETRAIPVVFLTARTSSDEAARLKMLGARGVVLKPFDPMTLARDVMALLES
ncbi:MAG TPA: response regulator [Thermoanaerobaculia bacterium]|nr:response regulator [Thermoanaerobaculia bacterium]